MGKLRDFIILARRHAHSVLSLSHRLGALLPATSPAPARHVGVSAGRVMAQLRERPEWQADKDAPICSRCKAEFTFFFRKVRPLTCVPCMGRCLEWAEIAPSSCPTDRDALTVASAAPLPPLWRCVLRHMLLRLDIAPGTGCVCTCRCEASV